MVHNTELKQLVLGNSTGDYAVGVTGALPEVETLTGEQHSRRIAEGISSEFI